MHSLDKINFKKCDPENYILNLENFSGLLSDAWRLSACYTLPSFYIKANKFVLLGMGASGISGDILKDLLFNTGLIIEVVHDYTIPKWADKDTVVIASSYSGNTEETLSAFFDAYERRCKLVAITAGGRLKSLASKFQVPLFTFDFESTPRAAFPYLFILLLSVFVKLGHYQLTDSDFEKITQFIEAKQNLFKPTSLYVKNKAKVLASKLFGTSPIIYGSGNLKRVALRMKTQINENSKNFAAAEFFPELNHNAIEGYLFPKNQSSVVLLESNFDQSPIVQRQNITNEILKKHKIFIDRIKFTPCDNELAELLSMVIFGDFCSYYLAILNGVKPSTNKEISFLKDEMVH